MYRVYMAELKETGEVYIGMTKETLKKRIGRHLYIATNERADNGKSALADLIRRQGISNLMELREEFNLVVLKDNIESKEEAAFYEKSFISFYDNVIEEAIVVNKRKPKDENFWIAAMLEDK